MDWAMTPTNGEFLLTILSVLILTTVETFKYAFCGRPRVYKTFKGFVLIAAGVLWGGIYGLWQADCLCWPGFKKGVELGIYVAFITGVSYGIIKSIRDNKKS
ncbi:hypothetical protein F9B85_02435 [Heliorestis acidaminivorans]|uniref:Uncharacterized protein n=1 Tax=Heliorestis acidaminivorans TaxID=553427 RepID=A0A6I0F6E7_9FIRM|nr:hypothetical protein [Heliorestis acidaminivorans]KAB2954552.1 hypothetical protein F9B85_02435 [Heliorestis acidaminivorans]